MNNSNSITPDGHEFLQSISVIAKPPETLWYIGSLPKRTPTVAIVGSRKPTAYGREITLRLASELARHGVIIVSGLALGIDGLAARGALEGGGITVAVMGTPIDQIYPRSNFTLAQDIMAHQGAILSEIGPGQPFHPKTSFLARNRLISALADVVIVVEAGERSGTLNTAGHAIEQGKELLVVPGNITSPMSAGCNQLIAQGATPLLRISDILEKLGIDTVQRSPQTVSGSPEEKLIYRLVKDGVSDGDELIKQSHLSAAEVSMSLTMLEIHGAIHPLGANRWGVK
jgi:DNA processing protein